MSEVAGSPVFSDRVIESAHLDCISAMGTIEDKKSQEYQDGFVAGWRASFYSVEAAVQREKDDQVHRPAPANSQG